MHNLSVYLWDLRTIPLWSKWTKDLTLYCLNKIKEIMILLLQNSRKPVRQTILLIGIIWWVQFQSSNKVSNNTWIYVYIKKLDKISTPIPTPTLESFNSNSNSGSFNPNSNSNSGQSPEYQLQLQLREFQLQLRQVSWISTPTPTPTPTPEVSTPIPTPELELELNPTPTPTPELTPTLQGWCCQAISHYLSQCWPSSMAPLGHIVTTFISKNLTNFKQHIDFICLGPLLSQLVLHAFQPTHVFLDDPHPDFAGGLHLGVVFLAHTTHKGRCYPRTNMTGE